MDILFGENGLLSGRTMGKTVIVMSTLDPELMSELGAKVEAESDLKLVSAAVSGGASGAQAGTLSIMTSGDEAIVKSFKPYFDAMGSNTFYYGESPGNSQVAKLVNNMILGITMNAVAEGLKLGEHYKLPEQEILNLLKVSTGDSWVVRNWSDVENWTAETALAVLLKDLKSAFLEGLKYNVALPFNALAATQLSIRWERRIPERTELNRYASLRMAASAAPAAPTVHGLFTPPKEEEPKTVGVRDGAAVEGPEGDRWILPANGATVLGTLGRPTRGCPEEEVHGESHDRRGGQHGPGDRPSDGRRRQRGGAGGPEPRGFPDARGGARRAGDVGRIPATELPHRHPGDIDLGEDHDSDGDTRG